MSRALRKMRALRSRLLGRVEPLILMYHRVASLACDPWRLAVTPERFDAQIEVLTRLRTIVPLDWLVEKLEDGRVPERAVALTFDDGYVDVLHNARPVLERHGVTATAYFTTGAIGRRREFWWDAVSRIVLESPTLPDALTLEVDGRRHVWRVDAGGDRTKLHFGIWDTLRPLAEHSRAELLGELERWSGSAPSVRSIDRALDADEARELAASEAFTIGAHSLTHASLPRLSDDEKRREVNDSRAACEELLGASVTSFAYPFGDRDRATERIVAASGFRHACATDPGVAVTIRDRFHLPRIAVENWGAAELEERLAGIG
jgi:peptidoglycan/xylan/chitin deacetylase (PgdA/CDA1 family)